METEKVTGNDVLHLSLCEHNNLLLGGGRSLQNEKRDSTFDVNFSICLGFYELYLKEIWQIIMNWKVEILFFVSKVWLSFVGIPS